MKYRDIERMASDAVRDYMDDGWVLELRNSSFSDCRGVHFLSRDGERIAVGIRASDDDENLERGWRRSVDVVLMFISRAPKCSFDWLDPENVIYEKALFKVDADWYVEDERTALDARATACARLNASRRLKERLSFLRGGFHPTKAFLDKWILGRCGWKSVKPADVIISRRDGFYHIYKCIGNHDSFDVVFPYKR